MVYRNAYSAWENAWAILAVPIFATFDSQCVFQTTYCHGLFSKWHLFLLRRSMDGSRLDQIDFAISWLFFFFFANQQINSVLIKNAFF